MGTLAMATRKLELAASASLRPDLKALLGPPPLLDGEDPSAFDAHYEEIRSTVAPRDHLEEIWVRDVVNIRWETSRLKRLKATLMGAYGRERVQKLLASGEARSIERFSPEKVGEA